MKLGGSLKRTRKGRGRAKGGKGSAGGGRGWGRVLVMAAGLALAGWALGWLVATQLVFPAPPPPGDLYEVPDVRGLGLTRASERLAGSSLALGAVDSLQHPSVAAGEVLGQAPFPGQLATPGSEVRVTISTGPQTRAVPDVLRLNAERARIVLESSGFVVTVDSVQSDLPRGRVARVAPSVDTVLALPAEVSLSVSTGPPIVIMPLVVGMQREEAEAALEELGLVVSEVEEVFRFGRDRGIVVEQQPAADSELERGAAVRLAVGRSGGL